MFFFFYIKVIDFIAKLLFAVGYHQNAQKTWSPKKEPKSKQNKYFLNVILSSEISWLLCKVFKAPSSRKPQMIRRWGHLSAPSHHPSSVRIGHPQREKEVVKDLHGNFKLSLAKAMLPLLRTPAPALFNLTQSPQFYLKLASIIMVTIFSLHLGTPFSVSGVPGCSHSLMLYFMHMVAHEYAQLRKTWFMHRAVC